MTDQLFEKAWTCKGDIHEIERTITHIEKCEPGDFSTEFIFTNPTLSPDLHERRKGIVAECHSLVLSRLRELLIEKQNDFNKL